MIYLSKEKNSTFKKIRFPLIMSIITFLIGIIFSYGSIGVLIKAKVIILLISFMPFILFSIFTFITYKFKETHEIVFVFKIISIIITSLLVLYYFIAMFFVIFIEVANPVINPKYYNQYISGSRLKKAFPSEIPDNVENVKFYYAPGILQAGTNYSLYYIDKNMTLDKFNQNYKDKAIWIGHNEEYTEKEGLFAGAFSYTPAEYENENDYIIYLIEGDCDDSGYCNHGNLLFAAYNEKTNEVIYRSEQW